MSLFSDSGRLSDSLIPSPPPSSGSVGSEGERSEPERATEPDDGGRATPDPEVVHRPVRRRFTVDYKQRILTEVDAAADTLRNSDTIILQFEIPLETVYYTVHFARQHNIRCIVNPAPAAPVRLAELAAADYFVPNETEAEAISGLPVHSIDDAKKCAAALLQKGFRKVILTLGARGSLLATAQATEVIAPFQVTPKDTTGAGDAFIGSFSAFLAEGLPEQEALSRANLYAAVSTLRVGTQKSFPKRSEFEDEWNRRTAKL